jgi:hypothetical protein
MSEFNMADMVVNKLGLQIGDLVVQLAMKDAQIEELQARLQVQQAASEPT